MDQRITSTRWLCVPCIIKHTVGTKNIRSCYWGNLDPHGHKYGPQTAVNNAAEICK